MAPEHHARSSHEKLLKGEKESAAGGTDGLSWTPGVISRQGATGDCDVHSSDTKSGVTASLTNPPVPALSPKRSTVHGWWATCLAKTAKNCGSSFLNLSFTYIIYLSLTDTRNVHKRHCKES